MTTDPLLDAKILVVDDERANVLLIERLLESAGYRKLSSTTDSRQVLGAPFLTQPLDLGEVRRVVHRILAA